MTALTSVAITLAAVGCLVRRTTSQTISNNTDTNVIWNVEDAATSGSHSTTVNPERLIATVSGWYSVHGAVRWASSGAGVRVIEIRKNGSGAVADRVAGQVVLTAGGESAQDVSANVKLSAGEYVTIDVFQSSGGNLAVDATSVEQPTASLVFLGT